MAAKAQKGWQELCQVASTERDPEKLLHLVSQINSLLLKDEKKRARSETMRSKDDIRPPKVSPA
jgi:hypothetical protein